MDEGKNMIQVICYALISFHVEAGRLCRVVLVSSVSKLRVKEG